MRRKAVYRYRDANGSVEVGWFDPSAARRFEHIASADRPVDDQAIQGNQVLYQSEAGRWILETSYSAPQVADRCEFLTEVRAYEWLEAHGHHAAATELAESMPPERSAVVEVWLGDLYDPIVQYSQVRALSLPDAIVEVLRRGVTSIDSEATAL